jgi:hypothetical protein
MGEEKNDAPRPMKMGTISCGSCFQIEGGGSRSRVGALGSHSLLLPQSVPAGAVLPFQRLEISPTVRAPSRPAPLPAIVRIPSAR